MIKQQRKALSLLVLACLVMLVCITQRVAGMHSLVASAPEAVQSVQHAPDGTDEPVAPCELSAKSLVNVPPVLFEGALFAITLLLVMLAASPPRIERLWPPRVISPPRLRVHLRLCVFRE